MAKEYATIVSADVGQLWRDEDGKRWRIVAVDPTWIYVKPHGYPLGASIQTDPAWLTKWVRES